MYTEQQILNRVRVDENGDAIQALETSQQAFNAVFDSGQNALRVNIINLLPPGVAPVIYNNSDTTINLTVADLNKVWAIDNAANVVVNLPSIAASEIGYWIEFQKLGAGNLTINGADADAILDGTSIANTVAAQTYAFLRLFLATETLWRMKGSLGSWSTF